MQITSEISGFAGGKIRCIEWLFAFHWFNFIPIYIMCVNI